MQYLIKMQLGPVQDFIVQAQSTRDMWAGSYLLSWLTAALMKPFYEHHSMCKFVFPSLDKQPLFDMYRGNGSTEEGLIPTLPNLFMVQVTVSGERELEALVQQAEKQAKDERDAISLACWQRMKTLGAKAQWKERWDAQLQGFPQITWRGIPIDDKDDKWNETVAKLGQEIAARRNTRDFEQWGWNGKSFDQTLVSCPKDIRSGKEEIIGTEEFWQRITVPEEQTVFKKSGPFGALNCIRRLFPTAYLEKKFDQHKKYWGVMSMINTRDLAAKNQKKESGELDTNREKKPANGYFAIIVMDGDRMGAKLQELESQEAYSQFSQKLATFSEKYAKGIVDQHEGQLIYAGGDDVLAMTPADQALELAEQLATTFKEVTQMESSCGIAVAHYMFPLQRVVQEARKAETRAKQQRKRNAFAMSLLKRSGETIHWGGKWDSAACKLYCQYSEFAKRAGSSARFPYALAERLAPYDLPKADVDTTTLQDILDFEYRHVRRQQELEVSQNEGKKLDELAKNYLEQLFQHQGGGPEDFAKLFLASAFMNRPRG